MTEIMNDQQKRTAYNNARKRIDEERGFYTHLAAYIIMNIIIILFKIQIGISLDSTGYNNFLVWNVILTPILWGIGLLIHGLWVFRRTNGLKKIITLSFFSKEWEQKKINKFMDTNEH